MQWIDSLIDCTETTAQGTANFSPDHFGANEGAALETALVECVAQTAAAALGQRAHQRQEPAGPVHGMLAAVSNFRIHSPPPTGMLQIEVRELKRFGRMLLIAGSVSCQKGLIASGELTLYV